MKAKAIGWGVLSVIVLVLALYLYLGTARFILLAAGLVLAYLGLRFARWAFWPARELPRNRIRHQRIRMYLRLHPGPGHATWWELHRQWSRRACYKRAARVQVRQP
jgi:hypothetical protein